MNKDDFESWQKATEKELVQEMMAYRRSFHKYPETAWTEFRTASLVAASLEKLGYEVQWGKSVVEASARMGVPEESVIDRAYDRALLNGADPAYIEGMKGGFTGVVGVLKGGEGPVVALRFDMDANALQEAKKAGHVPFEQGFSSSYEGIMHACGHDGHTAVGLGVARWMAKLFSKGLMKGTLKLIFQPAEEGVRGAKSMVEAGVLQNVDAILGGHIMSMIPEDRLICAANGFLATTKMDVVFTGKSAHAGGAPSDGKNAMLAACSAVLNLSAIPRHKDGVSRINVGVIQAGTDRNVIADKALIQLETRGQTTAINNFVHDYALRIVEGAALMHSVEYAVTYMGESCGGSCSGDLAEIVREEATKLKLFDSVVTQSDASMGSEDFMVMMKRVQDLGGKGTYFIMGTAFKAGHHHSCFDIDEKCLLKMAQLYTATAIRIFSEGTGGNEG